MDTHAKSPFRAVVEPRNINFGGFPVRRLLPRIGTRQVGPWVFFDHMGPHRFGKGEGMDVIPHPHINLATVTYLFEGTITHRDSLGTLRDIEPGAINLMVAGTGIAHSERTPHELRATGSVAHGLQLWCALPETAEETEPSFFHYPAEDIPSASTHGADVRVMIGSAYGLDSPVTTFSPTLYVDVRMPAGSVVPVPEAAEVAVYAVGASLSVDGESLPEGRLGLLEPGARAVRAGGDLRCIFIGGDPLGKRYMWWNFVSSRRERIHQAMEDWREGRFAPVGGDNDEPAPLPSEDGYSFMKE
jgi:redox-sensitive bicupin YhaK (pirin superfamily)